MARTVTMGVTKSRLPCGEIQVHRLARSTDLPHIPIDVTKVMRGIVWTACPPVGPRNFIVTIDVSQIKIWLSFDLPKTGSNAPSVRSREEV